MIGIDRYSILSLGGGKGGAFFQYLHPCHQIGFVCSWCKIFQNITTDDYDKAERGVLEEDEVCTSVADSDQKLFAF
jgi:hypothetical protein